ncbi:MAG: hypothetical protein OXC62_06120 [Aestuariivita sp.]|nr:hypothetical protein [Aestuariivita sp.]
MIESNILGNLLDQEYECFYFYGSNEDAINEGKKGFALNLFMLLREALKEK